MTPAATSRTDRTGWRVFIDRGGTFTDIVAVGPGGERVVRKLLSENHAHYRDAVLAGIRDAIGLDAKTPLSAADLDEVRIGTTVATNALLERKGARTALLVTRGFRDALRIGYQNRPQLFARRIVLPEPLYERGYRGRRADRRRWRGHSTSRSRFGARRARIGENRGDRIDRHRADARLSLPRP